MGAFWFTDVKSLGEYLGGLERAFQRVDGGGFDDHRRRAQFGDLGPRFGLVI